jgi:transposase
MGGDHPPHLSLARTSSARRFTVRPIEYSLKRWTALARLLDDGRLCISNDAAERELRAVAVASRNVQVN